MARDGTGHWFTSLRNSYAIHNVLAQRPELSLYVIRWDGGSELEWMDLSDPSQRLKPFHFEIHYGKEEVRDQYYLDALGRALDAGAVCVEELFGFCDLFYRLPAEGPPTFLYAGQLYRRTPDWELLCDQWRQLSGREPATGNTDFGHFVRMALALPVVEEPMMTALCQFIELYGAYLTGGDGLEIESKVDTLNRDFFSPLWPIEEWVQSAISAHKFHLTPWNLEGGLSDWMKEGMGIESLPTTAMALMPVDDRGEALDPLRTLVRNARLQRAAIGFARTLPGAAATRLGEYGVSVITSARSGKSRGRARLELRECAQKLQGFVEDHLGVRSVVGIGPTLAPGAPLYTSHREAVLALHMCVQLGAPVLFHDEHGEREPLGYAGLHRAATELTEALAREASNEVKAASDRYVQLVLRYADERVEVARSHFLATLFQLFAEVGRRYPMSDEAREAFVDELTRELERAYSLSQVIDSFNQALGRINFVWSKSWHGPNAMRLEATLQYIRENFAEPLSLGEVARRSGFSVPAFTRAFKQTTGTSFLAYVRAVRVEHAKQLLSTTPMTLHVMAQACGFASQHHLIRSFKKVTGMTPGQYRQSHGDR